MCCGNKPKVTCPECGKELDDIEHLFIHQCDESFCSADCVKGYQEPYDNRRYK